MQRIDDLLAKLTLEEKVALCHGYDFMSTTPVERLQIPRMWVTDGPHGARGRGWGTTTSCAFPVGTSVGATWDVELAWGLGEAMGRQVRSKGANILLGPTMNIHRTPLAGRNFECYSEDPHLSSRLAVAAVRGIQSIEGIGACIKHLVCNDQEHERMTISSEVDERTLREIYLAPFEACVTEAQPWAIMTAYNRLDGTYCAEHQWLLSELVRDEWGFEGMFISDWWGTKSTAASALAGLDLEMPGPPVYFGDDLLQAVSGGQVDEEVINEKVRRLLSVMERGGRLDDRADTIEVALDTPDDRALIRRAGAEGMVLLRNEADILPLSVRRLAVIGPYADVARTGGGGSSEVVPHYTVSPLESIEAAGRGVDVSFARGAVPYVMLPEIPSSLLSTTDGRPGMDVSFFENLETEGDAVSVQAIPRTAHRWVGNAPVEGDRFSLRATTTFTPDSDGDWTFGLSAAGRARLLIDGELVIDNWTELEPGPGFFGLASKERRATASMLTGQSRTLTIEYRAATSFAAGFQLGCISPIGKDPVAEAAEVARRAEAALVVVGLDAHQESEGHDRASMDLPGGQDELVRAVAAAQPNTVVVVFTGSVISMPWADEVAAILQAWYPGQECGNSLSDVLFGATNPCGKLPTTIPRRYEDNPTISETAYPGVDGKVVYDEGLLVGYRHYDTKGVEPLYPLGHGLSYTSFTYSDLEVDRDGDQVLVSLEVTNTGEVGGKEVVQLYVRDPECSVPRPDQELRAFEKLWLEPGQTKPVTLTLGPRAFAFWDEARHQWTAEPGSFELLCGSSSRDIRSTATIAL